MELHVKARTELGKKAKGLRKAGFLLAVVYGEKTKSQAISIPYRDFERVYKEAGESTIISLHIDDEKNSEGKNVNVLIYGVDHNPITNEAVHADFYAVDMNKVIQTEVQLEFIGEAPGVKNYGGILIRVHQQVEVEALPKDLPHSLEVDIRQLTEIDSKIHVSDIKLPTGVKILADANEVVALIEERPAAEEIEEVEAGVETAEVQTEREVKAAEKGTEDGAAEEEKTS